MKIYGITSENKFKEYTEFDFQNEHEEAVLESWLENNPDKIIENGNLLIIGRQVPTNLGQFIDLLAIDRQGDLVVIELKRDRTPRETLAQALEYVSSVEMLGYSQLDEIFRNYLGEEALNLAQYHRDYFNLVSDEAVVFNNDQRIVIVGQKISQEIRQTSTYLGKKGVCVTCLEFTFFKAEGGLRLFSTNTVVSDESTPIPKVTSTSLPVITETDFLNSLDQNGKFVFDKLLTWAKSNSLPVHWGTKGFSLNVDLSGTHVVLCYGYPPTSVYKQSIYTALLGRGGLSLKTDVPQEEIQVLFAEAQNSGLFQPAGRDLKCVINQPFSESQINWMITWLEKMVGMIGRHGLKGQSENLE